MKESNAGSQSPERTESSKKQLGLQEFFKFLVSKKNAVNCVQDPKGRSLIIFLSQELKLCTLTIRRKIKELISLGYVQKEAYKNKLFRVKILKTDWDENLLPPVPSPAAPEENTSKAKRERSFLVFIDYENLRRGLNMGPTERLKKLFNLSWLLDPILKKGKVLLVFVFVPENAPLAQLSRQGFFPIPCPRQFGGVVTKDKDTVDARMENLARVLIEHTDATDVLIISGDADFQPLVAFARFQQKRVTVASTREALSGRFLEMEKAGEIEVELIDPDKN
jgi:hypothetical protein